MSLQDRIQTDIAAAMRGGDALRRDVLRMAVSAAYNVEKRKGRPLTEDEFLAVLSARGQDAPRIGRGVPRRRPRGPRRQGRGRDRDPLRVPAPGALTEAEIAALVREAIAATGAASARDMGKVMGWLSPRTRGRADGKHVSELVAQALAGADLAAHDGGAH